MSTPGRTAEGMGKSGGPGSTTYLAPTRQLRFRLMLNHLVPGAILVYAGIGALREEGRLLLALAEIIAGGGVLGASVAELIKPAHGEREAVGWVEVFAGLMLMVEGAHVHHPGRWFQPALFYVAAGVATIGIGLGYSRLPRRRRMVLDDDGFLIVTSTFHRMKQSWDEVAGYDWSAPKLRVMTRDGRSHSINLGLVANRDEVVRTFAGRAERLMSAGAADEKAPPPPPTST